jgi:hypothetical protein
MGMETGMEVGAITVLPAVSIHFNSGLEQAARNASVASRTVHFFIQVPPYHSFIYAVRAFYFCWKYKCISLGTIIKKFFPVKGKTTNRPFIVLPGPAWELKSLRADLNSRKPVQGKTAPAAGSSLILHIR